MKSPGRGRRGSEGGKGARVPRKGATLESAVNTPNRGEVVLYGAPDGSVRLDVRLEKETVWLALSQIAALFERDKFVISRHLRNVFSAGELVREAVVARNATTAADGKTYQVEFFNLDAILSVGYRVNEAGLRFYTRGMPGSEIRELIFEVREADEGGYVARALGESIFAEAESWPALESEIRDAVECHYDAGDKPAVVRLHFVRDQVLAL